MRSYCGFSQIHDEKVFVDSWGGGGSGAAGVDADADAVGVEVGVEVELKVEVDVDVVVDGVVDDDFVTCEAAPQATRVVPSATLPNNPIRERRCCDISLGMA